ncbi:MAG: DEAD/DEAH box helicase family protein [Bacilli bacterium]|nr:DEAD/DEAH box helicase family protein [Bacilli bacterium]
MNIFDYPHIKEAIENVLNDLEFKKRSCVIATMGIGKSAIATSAMLNYADKAIVFAAPRQLHLEQIQEHLTNMGYDLDKDFADLKFYTYAQLHEMIKKGIVPTFDLFVCDEFHAIAKKKRYESISKMFNDDGERKYLGLSATPILQWDFEIVNDDNDEELKKRVNMANVLYDGNVSFFYSLDEAFANDLFSIPIYDEFFVLSRNTREEAIDILKKRVGENISEEQIDQLVDYLNKEAGIVHILKKYLNLHQTKIMFYCRDFNDLLAKERLLRREFPTLDIYKTSCRLPKKENSENINEFKNNEFRDGNSKVLLSIRQMTEGFHTDGEMQIIFANKTNAYRDFLQKFGRGCSLGNKMPVRILDLGGNLTRISSLNFLHLRDNYEKKGETGNGIVGLQNVSFGGNITDLNNYIESICQTAYLSNRDKTDIYCDRIISNSGYLEDPDEKYKDGTYLRDWYKEMLKIAKNELRLYKKNKDYKISSDDMYVIEMLAYLENYLRGIDLPNVEDKRSAYYERTIEYGNVLPKSKDYCFFDGTYMTTWYNAQYKKVKELMKNLNQENYKLSKSNYDLLLWFNKLHTDLKIAWLDKYLGPQRREKNGEAYQRWSLLASEVDKNPKALKTKKLCEGIEDFYSMEEFITGAEKRMGDMADELFPCSNTSIEEIDKHLKLTNR